MSYIRTIFTAKNIASIIIHGLQTNDGNVHAFKIKTGEN
jgi:hypothetical protein